MPSAPALRLCAPCGYQGPSRACPTCCARTRVLRAVQDAGSAARAAAPRSGDHACPRCASPVACAHRPDLPTPPPRPRAVRLCAPCGTSGPAPRCPGCGARTVVLKDVARAERAALPDDGPPGAFPLFDETLADLLDHRCGACSFLFACGDPAPPEVMQ